MNNCFSSSSVNVKQKFWGVSHLHIYLFIYSFIYLFGVGSWSILSFLQLFFGGGTILKCLVKKWIKGKCCVVLWSSDFHCITTSFSKAWIQVLCSFKSCLWCIRYVMVKIWRWSQLEIRLKIFHWSTILKNKMIIMVKHTFNKIMVKHTFRMLYFR